MDTRSSASDESSGGTVSGRDNRTSAAYTIDPHPSEVGGDVNVAVRVLLPGSPGTSRSESETVQVTVALTVAGWPTGIPNPDVSTVTTGRQSRPSWMSAVMALDSAAVCARPGVSEIEACLAASRAAADTEPCAIEVRPAATTNAISRKTTGARTTSSSGALPSSRGPRRAGTMLRF